MTYSPPDSVVVQRIKRAFPPDELRDRGRALVERERKFDLVALFYTLSLGFAAGSDRSLQAFLERFVEMAECDELAYTSFTSWFSPALVATLREIPAEMSSEGVSNTFETSSSLTQRSFHSTRTPKTSTQPLVTIKPD